MVSVMYSDIYTHGGQEDDVAASHIVSETAGDVAARLDGILPTVDAAYVKDFLNEVQLQQRIAGPVLLGVAAAAAVAVGILSGDASQSKQERMALADDDFRIELPAKLAERWDTGESIEVELEASKRYRDPSTSRAVSIGLWIEV